jgi:hypothetical protein
MHGWGYAMTGYMTWRLRRLGAHSCSACNPIVEDFAGGQGTDGLTQAIGRLIDHWSIKGHDVAVVEENPRIGSHRLR